MKRFECQACGNEVHFLNTTCVNCERRLGYQPHAFELAALEPEGETWSLVAAPARRVSFCDNARFDTCNWLIDGDGSERLCYACLHNRMIPDLSVATNLTNWRKIEQAKHHLFYSLTRWQLPAPVAPEGSGGLIFDFLADTIRPDGSIARVRTGHNDGVITLNIAEGDDAEREKRRTQMREPYRTLLGHFRHEIGHYYWDVLVRDRNRLDTFRAVFGDENTSYDEALKKHYELGPPDDWSASFISSYATAHPWEDFAETWAHYIHIVDSLETARAYGMSVSGKGVGRANGTSVDFQPYTSRSATDIIDTWVPFTVALNSINRSMGQRDFYPFVLSPPVMEKLQFIHDIVHHG